MDRSSPRGRFCNRSDVAAGALADDLCVAETSFDLDEPAADSARSHSLAVDLRADDKSTRDATGLRRHTLRSSNSTDAWEARCN